jgi:ATP-dependent DNA ligase
MITYQDKTSDLYDGLPFMEIGEGHIPFPCVAEVKMDGEFQYLIKKRGKIFLANKKEYGRIRTDMPVTNTIDIPDDSVFVGELVYGGGKDFYTFARHKLDPECDLALHSCLRYNGENVWKYHTYVDNRKLLESQKFYNSKVCLIPKRVCRNQAELDAFFYEAVHIHGFEGIVIKDIFSKYIDGETGKQVKRKFAADNDFVIVGFESGTKRAKNLVVVVGHRVNGHIEPLTRVGGGFGANTTTKDDMLKKLIPLVTGKKGDIFSVEPKIVVTVKHNGIIRNEDGSVSSLRHPQFKTERLDKTVSGIDTIK